MLLPDLEHWNQTESEFSYQTRWCVRNVIQMGVYMTLHLRFVSLNGVRNVESGTVMKFLVRGRAETGAVQQAHGYPRHVTTPHCRARARAGRMKQKYLTFHRLWTATVTSLRKCIWKSSFGTFEESSIPCYAFECNVHKTNSFAHWRQFLF